MNTAPHVKEPDLDKTMSRTLIVLDTDVDCLWRRYLPGPVDNGSTAAGDTALIIDLKSTTSGSRPYYNDPVGWHLWLKKQRIEQLHLFLPGCRSSILWAAAAGSVKIFLHLTGALESKFLNYLALRNGGITQFHCAGPFIAHQLRQAGIEQKKIIVEIPPINLTSVSVDRIKQIRRQIHPDNSNLLLLALNGPQNMVSLKTLVWTAALLRHTIPYITLALSGAPSAGNQTRLVNWQKSMDADNMVYQDQGNFEWDELVRTCDAVIAGPVLQNEALRLWHARALDQFIIAPPGIYDEYLTGCPKIAYALSSTPRHLAQALFQTLEKDGIV